MEKLRVLITDDEQGMRLGVRRVLRNFQVDVPEVDSCAELEIEEAESGEAALQRIAEQRPDILILDHKMPGISGLDVLDRVASDRILRDGISRDRGDMLTIMITAYASIETAVRAVKRGAYDFLAKPFTPDELRNTVKKAAVRLVLAKQARRLADERSQVRLQLMRTLSHELQAPLNAIDGFLELIQQRPHGDRLEAYADVLQRSQERVESMRRLIKDLLEMTSVESSEQARELAPVDVVGVARGALDTFRRQAQDLQLTLSLHAEQPLVMRGVENELRMVVENLISNAVKYNRPGGEIHVTIDRSGSTVSIGVSDTGWGIAPTEIDRLCEEFVRVKNEHTRSVAGTGLGLSIVKKIARRYGGEVLIDSEEGTGSKFTVVLNDAQRQAAPEGNLAGGNLLATPDQQACA